MFADQYRQRKNTGLVDIQKRNTVLEMEAMDSLRHDKLG